MIAAADLRAIIHYDPETGVFTRRSDDRSASSTRTAGRWKGRVQVWIPGYRLSLPAGRAAWLYVTGETPAEEIDHIDRNPSNNRFANLRVATRSENASNRKRQTNNTSGAVGVTREGSRWRAQIFKRKPQIKNVILGRFDSFEEAVIARREAERLFFGRFAP